MRYHVQGQLGKILKAVAISKSIDFRCSIFSIFTFGSEIALRIERCRDFLVNMKYSIRSTYGYAVCQIFHWNLTIHAMNVALVSFFKELIHVFHTSRRYTMYNVYVYIYIY